MTTDPLDKASAGYATTEQREANAAARKLLAEVERMREANLALADGFHAATCGDYGDCTDPDHATDTGRALNDLRAEAEQARAELAALKRAARDLLDALGADHHGPADRHRTREAYNALHALTDPTTTKD